MEIKYKSQEMVSCGHCGSTLRQKNFEEHLLRKHPGKSRAYARSEEHASQLRAMWDEQERKRKECIAKLALEKQKQKAQARLKEKQQALLKEREEIELRKLQAEEQEKIEKKKKAQRKRKRSNCKRQEGNEQPEHLVESTRANPTFVQQDHDYLQNRRPHGPQHTATSQSDPSDKSSFQSESERVVSSANHQSMYHGKEHVLLDEVVKSAATSHAVNEEKVREQFRVSRSLEDLREHVKMFNYCEEEKTFACLPCEKYQAGARIAYTAKDDDTQSTTQEKFRELKKKLLGHLYSSSRHKSAVQAIRDDGNQNTSADNNSDDDLEYKAGMAVGRAAYGCIKRGRSYLDFETDMCMRSADQALIGDINHSATFASSLSRCFHDELHSRITNKLQQQLLGTGEMPPFSVVCDKMTPSRHTLHNIGIVSPVDNGRLRATFLEARPSKDGTGMGLAQEINHALRRVFSADDIRSRFRGMAVDGAYINCNIKEHILDSLAIPDEARDSYAINWDPAHQLELAGKASRKQDGKSGKIGVEWIRTTVTTLNNLAMKYGRGKGWTQLNDNRILNQCQDIEAGSSSSTAVRVTKLQNFSTTRFTTFAHRAISAVRKNWDSLYDCINSNPDDKVTLTNPTFILRLCGLDDVYSKIGKTSIYLQSSRIYPWNVGEQVECCITSLNGMAEQLEESGETFESTSFPALSCAVNEIKTHSTYKGKTLGGLRRRGEDLDSRITEVMKDLAENIRSFTDDLSKRHEKTSENATKLAREVFAVKKIQGRPQGCVPSDLTQLYDMHKRAGFISASKTFDDVKDEYRCFLNAVYRESDREANTSGDFISKEEEMYSKFLSKQEPANEFPTVAKMLASSACQTQCEAITEGWGSVLDSLAKRKVNVDPEKLSQETFIKLNGPPPSSKCNAIIEGGLDRHFGGRHKWHFFRTSRHVQDKGTSRVVSRLSAAKEGFPLEDE